MFQEKFVMLDRKRFAKMSKEMNAKSYQLKEESDNAPTNPSKYTYLTYYGEGEVVT